MNVGSANSYNSAGLATYRKELSLAQSTEMKGESSNDSGKIPEIH